MLKQHKTQNITNKAQNHSHQIMNQLCKIGFSYCACPNLGGIVTYEIYFNFIIFVYVEGEQKEWMTVVVMCVKRAINKKKLRKFDILMK